MRVGIVGHAADKFTPETEAEAKALILALLCEVGVTEVVSGGCHLGGVDLWAAELGRWLGLAVTEFLPASRSWSGGYKERNLEIARASDAVYSICVGKYPPGYTGMRFTFCYHCHTSDHVKSGGCWTAKQARRMGKPGITLIV